VALAAKKLVAPEPSLLAVVPEVASATLVAASVALDAAWMRIECSPDRAPSVGHGSAGLYWASVAAWGLV